MGRIGNDVKNLILGNDGSDKEPDDFKTELSKAIKKEMIDKAEGTILLTARDNCEKLAKLISRNVEDEVKKASKENGIEFDSIEEAKEYLSSKENKIKKEKEEKARQIRNQELSLEQQIQASQNEAKAKIKAEKNLEKVGEIEKNK